jgi:hypothetical protein
MCKLLDPNQVATFSISHDIEPALLAGIIRQVSSAYFHISLPGVTACKSAAATTYDAGPIAEPCTILEFISR